MKSTNRLKDGLEITLSNLYTVLSTQNYALVSLQNLSNLAYDQFVVHQEMKLEFSGPENEGKLPIPTLTAIHVIPTFVKRFLYCERTRPHQKRMPQEDVKGTKTETYFSSQNTNVPISYFLHPVSNANERNTFQRILAQLSQCSYLTSEI